MKNALRAMRWLSCAALSVPIAAHAAAAPSTEDMARCAAIAAPGARLACYDALSHRPADAAPATAAATATAPRAVPANPAPVATPAPATAAPAAVDALDDPKNFGLTLKQQHRADAGPKSVQARIMKISPDRPGSAVIVLDIGNTWLVSDDDGWLSKGDQVTIKRAALKSYLLIAPSHHTYRVSRIE